VAHVVEEERFAAGEDVEAFFFSFRFC